ncbi:MAG: tRNA-dihydrouridine synthase family protein [Candidatus Colwellbacteria bacterium]|nr:tRNA-dihydrouridine synthase family protein [Candidatus Colwellbacteria bacterium]
MNQLFWDKLSRPISASAPMAGVTDAAFREMLAKYGKPSVIWTEMVSLTGMKVRGEENFENEMRFSFREKPVVLQVFGSNPDEFLICGEIAERRGFDGIDINMGCPDQGVEKQGSGACLIKSSSLAQEIIIAAKEGSRGLPVSVKTRIGYSKKSEMEKWMEAVASARPAAITIHGRTRSERREGRADWKAIAEAREIIKSINKKIIVLGNGDIISKEDGEKKSEETGIDGYMAGRAIIGNPWFFIGKEANRNERIKAAVEHAILFEKIYGETEPFDLMKNHFAGYLAGFDGAKELRIRFMAAKNSEEAAMIADSEKIDIES